MKKISFAICCLLLFTAISFAQVPAPEYTIFRQLKITDIQPRGWIKEFLERQKSGLTGHIEVAGYPYNTSMWAGPKIEGSPEAWWPYEQTGYYIDGVHRLGLILNDPELVAKATKNTSYVMEHVDSNGRVSTKLTDRWCRWPYAGFFRNYMTDYELTKDERIVQFMQKHYLTFTANDFADDLELANVEELCWLYGITKDERLLKIAEDAYQLFKSDIKYRNRAGSDIQFGSDKVPNHHGVVYLELLKIPAILYSHTGKKEYLEESVNGAKTMEKYHMLISGLPSSTEHFKDISELAGSETCNTAVLPYTYGYLLRITGDASYADKIEKAVFNAAMGSVTLDFKSHQYFSAPNQFIATLNSNIYGYNPARMAYLPGHDVECCTGNVNRVMPYFVEDMWLQSNDSGLVASLYGPSEVKTTVSRNVPVLVLEETNYPFDETIKFKISTGKNVIFPFYVRIPQWCRNARILVNGKPLDAILTPDTFYKIERTFTNNDVITLSLPMQVKTSKWINNGIGVERGPLVFSFPIQDKENIVKDYKKSNPDFPAIERKPAEAWNYALSLGNGDIKVIQTGNASYPWDFKNCPIKLQVPVKKVTNWKLDKIYDAKTSDTIFTTSAFPKNPVFENKVEYIDLVPYGSTTLRVSVFPEDNRKTSKNITGNVQFFPDFKSSYVDDRNIEIWFPAGYETNTGKKYPVLYMHDGQNLFEPGHSFTNQEWEVDETMTRLIKENKIKDAIVVGIWNTPKRFREYQPNKIFDRLKGRDKAIRDSLDKEYNGTPLADAYLKFIVEELKPFVDKTFRTLPDKENTFMMGSSMGGLISIYAIAEYPNVFGGVACLSTHFPIGLKQNNPKIPALSFEYLQKKLSPRLQHKIYFDYGTETLDSWYEPYQKQMDMVMVGNGFTEGLNWKTLKFTGEEHSEISWRKRLEVPLVFLLGK